MVCQGHLHVEEQVGCLTGDLNGIAVLAGHHELSTLLADLLEDPVVATLEQPIGVAPRFRNIAPTLDHPHQFGADISRGRRCSGTTGAWGGAVVVEATAGTGVASHISPLLNGEQQHVSIAVVAERAQVLTMTAAGPLVPELTPRAAPVMDLGGGQTALDRLAIHPGDHQHSAIEPVLSDSRDQTSLVKTELIDEGWIRQHRRLGIRLPPSRIIDRMIGRMKGCLQGPNSQLPRSSRSTRVTQGMTAAFTCSKTFSGYPCCHRQWRHSGHCRFVHGYSRSFTLWFRAHALDAQGFVVDFSSLGTLEAQLAGQFDHTFLVNADDPLLEEWQRLHDQGALDLRVMDNVGMESSARLVWSWANTLLHGRDGGRSCCWKVEARENEKNAACFEAVPPWFRP